MNRPLSAVRMSRVALCAVVAFRARRCRRRRPADRAAVDAAKIDDAGRALGAVAVDAVMRREEVPVERLERVGGIGLKRNFEVVGLPDVADIGEVEDLRLRGGHDPRCASAWRRPGRGRRGPVRPPAIRGLRAAAERPRSSHARSGAKSRPVADSTPGCGGTAMRRMPSSRASAVAWRGPPPPSGRSV